MAPSPDVVACNQDKTPDQDCGGELNYGIPLISLPDGLFVGRLLGSRCFLPLCGSRFVFCFSVSLGHSKPPYWIINQALEP
jgi:hypothetical protein